MRDFNVKLIKTFFFFSKYLNSRKMLLLYCSSKASLQPKMKWTHRWQTGNPRDIIPMHRTFPERLNCSKWFHASQVLWASPGSCLTLCTIMSAWLKILYHYKNVYFYPTQHALYLLTGAAPLSFESKAARVTVRAGNKDAGKLPPLFSDALNHSFPEESWRVPRLPQIQLCLFRCWLHTPQQSSGRPSSHCILGSATKKPSNNKKKPTLTPPPPPNSTKQKKPHTIQRHPHTHQKTHNNSLWNFSRCSTFSLKVYMLCLSLYVSIFPLPSTASEESLFKIQQTSSVIISHCFHLKLSHLSVK